MEPCCVSFPVHERCTCRVGFLHALSEVRLVQVTLKVWKSVCSRDVHSNGSKGYSQIQFLSRVTWSSKAIQQLPHFTLHKELYSVHSTCREELTQGASSESVQVAWNGTQYGRITRQEAVEPWISFYFLVVGVKNLVVGWITDMNFIRLDADDRAWHKKISLHGALSKGFPTIFVVHLVDFAEKLTDHHAVPPELVKTSQRAYCRTGHTSQRMEEEPI